MSTAVRPSSRRGLECRPRKVPCSAVLRSLKEIQLQIECDYHQYIFVVSLNDSIKHLRDEWFHEKNRDADCLRPPVKILVFVTDAMIQCYPRFCAAANGSKNFKEMRHLHRRECRNSRS